MTNHFNESVDQELRDKMQSIAQAIESDFISDYSGAGMGKQAYGCFNLDQIYGYHISGYMPYTLGGYEITELYSNGPASGAYFTQGEDDFGHDTDENCFKAFCLDNDIEAECISDLDSELQDEFSEYQSEWHEPTLLRVELWIETSGEIFVRLSCNYSDAPYYRTRHDEDIKSVSFTRDEFMAIQPDKLIETINA